MAGIALAGLAEALDVSDIIAEGGELIEEWATPSSASNFIGPLEETPAGVAEYVQGTLGIGGAAGAPMIPQLYKRLRFDSMSSTGSTHKRDRLRS